MRCVDDVGFAARGITSRSDVRLCILDGCGAEDGYPALDDAQPVAALPAAKRSPVPFVVVASAAMSPGLSCPDISLNLTCSPAAPISQMKPALPAPLGGLAHSAVPPVSSLPRRGCSYQPAGDKCRISLMGQVAVF